MGEKAQSCCGFGLSLVTCSTRPAGSACWGHNEWAAFPGAAAAFGGSTLTHWARVGKAGLVMKALDCSWGLGVISVCAAGFCQGIWTYVLVSRSNLRSECVLASTGALHPCFLSMEARVCWAWIWPWYKLKKQPGDILGRCCRSANLDIAGKKQG